MSNKRRPLTLELRVLDLPFSLRCTKGDVVTEKEEKRVRLARKSILSRPRVEMVLMKLTLALGAVPEPGKWSAARCPVGAVGGEGSTRSVIASSRTRLDHPGGRRHVTRRGGRISSLR